MRKSAPRIMQTVATGSSMTPLIASGTSIMLDTSSKQRYQPGDIVVYIGQRGMIVVHRILFVALTSSGRQQYLLKGDHNRRSDRYIETKQLLGKVRTIVYPSFEIDLGSPLSSFAAYIIAGCGRITLAHRRFYIIERMVTICLSLVIVSYARFRRTHR